LSWDPEQKGDFPKLHLVVARIAVIQCLFLLWNCFSHKDQRATKATIDQEDLGRRLIFQ
jgi:hypothetical protein